MTPVSRRHLAIAAAVWVGSLAFLWSFDPLARPVLLDPATWDYMSLALSDGHLPYRDVFLHKTPGAIFLGALGARCGAWLGLTPVAGAHTLFVLLGAAGPALLYLLVATRMGTAAAVAAPLFMLAFDQWTVAAVEGVRPKIATTVLGLGCLLAGSRRRYGVAGVLGGAATLCWQPGLTFLVGAAYEAITSEPVWPGMPCARHARGDRRARPTRLARLAQSARLTRLTWLVLGAALPVVALATWLAAVGALDAFLAQAVGFNVHYIAVHARTPLATLARLFRQAAAWNPLELVLLPLAAAGLARDARPMSPGLAVAGLLYLAMAFISFQAWPDMILLAPVVAAVLAAGLPRLAAAPGGRRAMAATVVTIATMAAAMPASRRLDPPITWTEQAEQLHELAGDLRPDDRVLVVSLPEFLVHTGRHSIWPWPYMWFGVDAFAAATHSGGFEALIAELDTDPPPLMLVARRWHGPLRERFEAWAASRYERERIRQYPHTKRPINVYRLKR